MVLDASRGAVNGVKFLAMQALAEGATKGEIAESPAGGLCRPRFRLHLYRRRGISGDRIVTCILGRESSNPQKTP